MHVSLAAEKIIHLGSFGVSNTFLTSVIVTAGLSITAILISRKLRLIPKGIQNIFEFTIESLFKMVENVTGSRQQALQFFPLVATIFLFVICANWMGLLPGVGTIGFHEINAEGKEVLAPILRSANSDLNITLALAVISVVSIQIFGVMGLGFIKYLKKFLNFKNPILFFVGLLEGVSEFTKMISFSFRLFGNVFAGEILLVVISSLVPFIAPLPFYFLEIFVGFVQALVFAMLTLVFLKIATLSHDEH